jgi:hypothetical protein
MERGTSRIEAARGRAAAAKQALVFVAATLFAAVLVGARASHPGEAAATSDGTTVADQTASDDQEQEFDFGQSDIGPSAGVDAGSSGGTTHAS